MYMEAKLSYAGASEKEESKLFYFSINGLCVWSSFMVANLGRICTREDEPDKKSKRSTVGPFLASGRSVITVFKWN